MSKPHPDPARRQILRRTGTATAAGVALAVIGPATTAGVAQPAAAPAQPEPSSRGYHETEHTRRYYELARF